MEFLGELLSVSSAVLWHADESCHSRSYRSNCNPNIWISFGLTKLSDNRILKLSILLFWYVYSLYTTSTGHITPVFSERQSINSVWVCSCSVSLLFWCQHCGAWVCRLQSFSLPFLCKFELFQSEKLPISFPRSEDTVNVSREFFTTEY